MTTVVTDNCLKCKFTECVSSCPVSAFRAGEEMLFIDPDVCIDCGACISKCPVKAIFEDLDLPEDMTHWVDTNATESKKWPKISAKMPPMDGANDRKVALGF